MMYGTRCTLRHAARGATVMLLAFGTTLEAAAQQPMRMEPGAAKDTTSEMMMSSPLGISMNRMGSGTTWIPDAVSLPSRHFMAHDWELMLHGFVFGQYDKQDGPRVTINSDRSTGACSWPRTSLPVANSRRVRC